MSRRVCLPPFSDDWAATDTTQLALRLFPPLPTNSRAAARDTVLPAGGGPDNKLPMFVPKGTTVRFSTYATHRRKDLFGEDAETFRPERWEDARPS